MAVRRSVGRSLNGDKIIWIARERKVVVARDETLDGLHQKLAARDASGVVVDDEDTDDIEYEQGNDEVEDLLDEGAETTNLFSGDLDDED